MPRVKVYFLASTSGFWLTSKFILVFSIRSSVLQDEFQRQDDALSGRNLTEVQVKLNARGGPGTHFKSPEAYFKYSKRSAVKNINNQFFSKFRNIFKYD